LRRDHDQRRVKRVAWRAATSEVRKFSRPFEKADEIEVSVISNFLLCNIAQRSRRAPARSGRRRRRCVKHVERLVKKYLSTAAQNRVEQSNPTRIARIASK